MPPPWTIRGIPRLEDYDKECSDDEDIWALRSFTKAAVVSAWDGFLDKTDAEELKREVLRLKYANDVLLLKLGTYCRGNFAELPHEILLLIFRNTLPPRWLLYGKEPLLSHSEDISSVDLRMKLSILAVCKSWNQLPVFVRALEGRKGLSTLKPSGVPCSLPATSSSITSLEFNSHIPYSFVLPFLVHLSRTLHSLAFTVPHVHYHEGHPELTFDALDDLYLKVERDSEFLGTIWRIPHLRRLWLRMYDHHPSQELYLLKGRQQAEVILDAYGHEITSLELPASIGPGNYLQEALGKCPALEHLFLYHLPTLATHRTVKFIDVFNLCEDPPFEAAGSPPLTEHSTSGITVASVKDRFPALQGCRNLDPRMRTLRDLPHQILQEENEFRGPHRAGEGESESIDAGEEEEDQDSKMEGDGGASDTEEDNGEGEEHVPDVLNILRAFTNPNSVNGGAFTRCDRSDDYVLKLEDEDEGSDTSDSDSDGGSCITVSEDEGYMEDEFYLEEKWEVDRDEALGVFYRTRANCE
ncbi:F-box domain-containing protein [Mycena venus]|uniref:F-box domain-containing protein n=1 Tax=Mycena venus TaxID=2733690 RepID=A0A8H6YDN5_9AGAR|nr:F-box domain-containing protein [Mycena venus]